MPGQFSRLPLPTVNRRFPGQVCLSCTGCVVCALYLNPIRPREYLMSRVLLTAVALLTVASLSGCANMDIGKGKGKAPPPVVVEEPAPAPVYK
jgi:hypothetical protein